MATTSARLLLLRQQQRRQTSVLQSPSTASRSIHFRSTKPILVSHQQHSLVRIQRRHYLFFPSDWAELRYRWKLFWENHTPTQVRLRWQERKIRLLDQRSQYLKDTKTKVSANFATTRTKVSANYQFQKMRLQRGYNSFEDSFERRRSDLKEKSRELRSEMKEKSREFTKRWKARQRDMVVDSRDMVRGYFRQKVFMVEEYAQPHWFDAKDGRPLTSRDPTGRFVNPWLSWSSNGVHSITNILKWRYQRQIRQWQKRGWKSLLPKDLSQMLFGSAIHAASNKTKKEKKLSSIAAPTEIDFTWIGHSTCLVKMGNATILTDPIFSHRCTPFQRLPGVGVAREEPPSINVEDLPETIDVCLISHDHYDHLDQLTILALRDRVKYWILPKGLPEWLESRCSVDSAKMIELEWWESVQFNKTNNNQWQVVESKNTTVAAEQEDTMTIICCPAQHWSSRTFFDRCKRLWCGFAVETQTHTSKFSAPVVQKFFFAGDTGLPRNDFPLFSLIGDFCGRGRYHPEHEATGTNDEETLPPVFHPFDLAAIPIGAYEPAFLMQEAHMNPEEAVQCAQQLQARKSVAIHWGTFELSEEPLQEPPLRLKEALDLPENDAVDFVALPIGGSLRVPAIHAEADGEIVEIPVGDETASIL